MQTSITILSSSTKYSSKFGASKKVNSQRPAKLLKTKYFKKKDKKANIPMKEKLAFFFLNYWVWQTSKTFHTGPRGLLTFFVQLIRYKIVFVRVRYSSEDFSKKGYFFVGRKNFGLNFHYSFHQFCLHPVTFFKFCQASTQICASFKILSVSLKSLLKTRTLQKPAKYQWKKSFGLLLLLSSSCGRLPRTFFKASESIQVENVQVLTSLLLRLTSWWKN